VITIVDYGVGNIAALLNMFDYLGVEARASADPREILSARKLLLPGVGAFDKAMRELRSRGLIGALHEAVLEKHTPILGVCLGMQLLALNSAEGNEPGLGWIPGNVRRIAPPAGSGLKVPHIGWSDVVPTGSSVLFPIAVARERFYFVHSFHFSCEDARHVAATIDYGGELVCSVSRGNIHGVQFHPEKSHRFGMRALASYAALDERVPS
jgi:glutamine amidotransferase